MDIRNRVKELRTVRGSELRANPRNWRTHPESQRKALRGVLEKIGQAGALLAYETDDGLELIDGHLRAEDYGDAEWPVLVLDVTREEADLILATHDPLAAMAQTDSDMLAGLVAEMESDAASLATLIAPLPIPAEPIEAPAEFPEVDESIPVEHQCPKCGYQWSGGAA